VAENLSFLPAVQDAVSRDRKLFIEYRKPNGQRSERTVDPLGLVAKGMSWYLVANTAEGFRTFRVSRIEKATLLEMAVERPPDFDLAAHWRSSTEKFRENRSRYAVTMRVERQLAEDFMSWRAAQILSADENDRVTLRADFEDEQHACFVLLGMGARAEVVEPEALRERVVAGAAALMAKYGG
jgi:predicted DNA-binding transcriptional regulator YafY